MAALYMHVGCCRLNSQPSFSKVVQSQATIPYQLRQSQTASSPRPPWQKWPVLRMLLGQALHSVRHVTSGMRMALPSQSIAVAVDCAAGHCKMLWYKEVRLSPDACNSIYGELHIHDIFEVHLITSQETANIHALFAHSDPCI